jgi:hypothetical protein
MFITVFTRTRHWSPTWPRRIKFTPSHLMFSNSTLCVSSHLRLGRPSGLSSLRLSTRSLHAVIFAPMRDTWPAHRILTDLIILTMCGEMYKLWSSSLCSLLEPHDMYGDCNTLWCSQRTSVTVPSIPKGSHWNKTKVQKINRKQNH